MTVTLNLVGALVGYGLGLVGLLLLAYFTGRKQGSQAAMAVWFPAIMAGVAGVVMVMLEGLFDDCTDSDEKDEGSDGGISWDDLVEPEDGPHGGRR